MNEWKFLGMPERDTARRAWAKHLQPTQITANFGLGSTVVPPVLYPVPHVAISHGVKRTCKLAIVLPPL